jgi:hypothetical protein
MLWIDTYQIIRTKNLRASPPVLSRYVAQQNEIMMHKKSLYSQPQVNQHPRANREGWIVSDQETVFCWVTVP